jgi:hypothetical protein
LRFKRKNIRQLYRQVENEPILLASLTNLITRSAKRLIRWLNLGHSRVHGKKFWPLVSHLAPFFSSSKKNLFGKREKA